MSTTIKNYIYQKVFLRIVVFSALIVVIFAFLVSTTYKEITQTAIERVSLRIEESFVHMRESVSQDIEKNRISIERDVNFLAELSFNLFLKDNKPIEKDIFETLLSQSFKSLSAKFEQPFYYFMTPEGTVYFTNHQPSIGLNLQELSKAVGRNEFWDTLQKQLENGIWIETNGTHAVTGTPMVFIYTRLENGDLLEFGIPLKEKFVNDSLKAAVSYESYVEQVGLYFVGNPVSDLFPKEITKPSLLVQFLYKPVFQKIIELEEPGTSYKNTYDLIMVFNFKKIFNIFLLVVALLITQLIFGFIVLRTSAQKIVREVDYLEVLVSEFSNYTAVSSIYESEFEEINDVSKGFQMASEIIAAEFQELKATNEELERTYNTVSRLSDEIKESFFSFAETIGEIVEGFENETGEHINRVKEYVKIITNKLDVDQEYKEKIVSYSPLHDVGKIFIDKSILLKNGPLTKEEWEEMKKHTVYAERILKHKRFDVALNIAKYHHENYDGTGYPEGLKGEDIPLEARIVKIADVFDALTTERPYKRAFSFEEAIKIMVEGDGRTKPEHFDPKLLEIFVEEIKKRYLA